MSALQQLSLSRSQLATCIALFFAAWQGAALAQEPEITIDSRGLGGAYAHLLSVAAEPEIAVSGVTIDNDQPDVDDIELLGSHLPLYREFDLRSGPLRWYTQASLGYLKLSESLVLDLEPIDTYDLEPEWEAISGILEVGLVIPLGHGFSFAPGISAGISRLENDTKFRGSAGNSPLPSGLDGEIFNWSTNASLARAHLGLRYDRKHGGYRIKGAGHLTYTYVDSYSESRDFAGFSDHSGAAIFKLDVSRRINPEADGHALYLIGHLGNTTFIGDNRSELGFESINEVGLSLGVNQYAAGVLYLFGEDAEGVTLSLNYNY